MSKKDNPFSKKQKFFSVISPCYGMTYKSLEKNAETLNEQEYKTFEWIVVFDGKHKRGAKVMDKIIKKYPKMDISYYHLPKHKGAPAARNFGATKAKGEIYVFLNADNYLYPEALRIWAGIYEQKPEVNRVWGLYDIITADGTKRPVGQVPLNQDGSVWYKAFKYSNFCDSSFPIRKSAYIEWDESVKSLQDWDWAIRQLKRDNFEGKDWHYIHQSFFAAEDAKPGGLSDDSHQNWIERTGYIKKKNGLKKSDMVITSLGASNHAFPLVDMLGADYLPMPSFKKHEYKTVYLIGFYTQEDAQHPYVTKTHMDVFANAPKATKIIHWIGSDILQLRWNCSFEKIKALKEWFKKEKIIHLAEAKFTQKELAEVGIKSMVVPLPPKSLFKPMPLPEKFSVAVYDPGENFDSMYKKEFVMSIVKAMPDIQFYFFGDDSRKGLDGDNFKHIGYIDYNKWFPRFSANLRITLHDGLPLTPIQFMTAGRNAIVTVPLKGAYTVKQNRKEIVSAIRKAKEKPINLKYSKYWRKVMDTRKFIKTIKSL